MLGNYLTFNFGESYFRSISVVDLVLEKMPVSITLGLWSTLLAYLISIPLGIRKAIRDGSRFDTATSGVIIVAYAIPSFLFAIMLLVLFAGGSYWRIFPLRGLTSDNWAELSLIGKVLDYLWHIALPVTASTIGAFATMTLLTKNSFLDEIKKQYVMTARAKGLSERRVLYGHVFRNAMLIVIAGFPAVFISVFFGGSLIIETIFSLDGLGRLAYESAIQRDYPVVFGTLYVFGLLGPGRRAAVGPHLCLGRSRASTSRAARPDAPHRPAAPPPGELPRQPPRASGRSGSSWRSSSSRSAPSSSPTTGRSLVQLPRRVAASRCSASTPRPTSAASSRPRPSTTRPRCAA